MDYQYIAGFFDGEGSAMVMTIRRNLSGKTIYRLRPTISIAQGTQDILKDIATRLGYGSIQKSGDRCYKLLITGNKNIIDFVNNVGKFSVLKNRQLKLLQELAIYQDEKYSNTPYNRESMEYMVDMRDKVFEANTWTRSRIKQKYSREKILQENDFIDIDAWVKARSANGKNALQKYAKSIKKERIKINCACGCGRKITSPDSKGRDRKYIRGHNNTKGIKKHEQY